MPRRGLSKSDYALVVNLLSRMSAEEEGEAVQDAARLRLGLRKPKKAAKPKAQATT